MVKVEMDLTTRARRRTLLAEEWRMECGNKSHQPIKSDKWNPDELAHLDIGREIVE